MRSRAADLQSYLHDQNQIVAARHASWLSKLPGSIGLTQLLQAALEQGDPQLTRLLRGYLPLTFSRRHGDPSRPWNWYSIRVHDDGDPVYGYEGNWRDIFQNWEALGVSYPGYLPQFISVFLNASTADGYNPYRITRRASTGRSRTRTIRGATSATGATTRSSIWLDLLEAYERHQPGALRARVRLNGSTHTPMSRTGSVASTTSWPTHGTPSRSIARVTRLLLESGRELGADGRLVRDDDGQVRLVTPRREAPCPPAGEAHQPRAWQRDLAQHPTPRMERREQRARGLGPFGRDAQRHRALREVPARHVLGRR